MAPLPRRRRDLRNSRVERETGFGHQRLFFERLSAPANLVGSGPGVLFGRLLRFVG